MFERSHAADALLLFRRGDVNDTGIRDGERDQDHQDDGREKAFNLLIGATTPPFGVLLFIVQHIAQVSFARLVRAMLPFYVPLVIALLLITYWPDLSLWLPRFVKG